MALIELSRTFFFDIPLTPFPVSPKGEKLEKTPSPLGEGWEGDQ
jgi:hypothetical protein